MGCPQKKERGHPQDAGDGHPYREPIQVPPCGVEEGKTKMTASNTLFRAASNGLRRARWIALPLSGALLLGAFGLSSPSSASPSDGISIAATTTIVVNAFGINPSADNLIPAPGTTPGVISEGDESIINDQLTTTHEIRGGYRIIGYASGTCTYTRIEPDGQAHGSPYNRTLEECLATAVLPRGSITAQGVIVVAGKSVLPAPAKLAVTGGTGRFDNAHGIVKVTFGSKFETLTIVLH
jgi:hypothetical protein